MRPDDSTTHHFLCDRCEWDDMVEIIGEGMDYECPECGLGYTVNRWERDGVFVPDDWDEDDAE